MINGINVRRLIFLLVLCEVAVSLHCHKHLVTNGKKKDVLLTAKSLDTKPLKIDNDFSKVQGLIIPQKLVQVRGDNSEEIMSFCPDKCSCDFTNDTSQLEVICSGHFKKDFPLTDLRRDVEILNIDPTTCSNADGTTKKCDVIVENHLTLGPIYKHLRGLKSLTIKYSNIPNIGRRTMWGLSGLKLLDLSHNKLTNIVDQNFEGLYSLKQLNLDNNLINSMVSAAFINIPQLEVLTLKNNKIKELATRIFYKLRNLRELDLGGNYLQHINGAIFGDIPNLETLRCEGCALFQLLLPDHTYLKRLSTLALGTNSIHDLKDIHPSLFNHLQRLELPKNKLSEVNGHIFWDSRRLNYLNLSGNNLTKISDCAFCNTSLRELDLSHNRLSKLNPKMIDWNSRTLHTVSLAGNWMDVKEVERFLMKMPNLEHVDLTECHLVSIPSSLFQSNPRLRSINMSNNYLINIDVAAFNQLVWLESLDLSSNYFMDFTQEFFKVVKRMSRLKMVYLQENRFVCDKCHIVPLLEWLESSLQYWGACFPNASNPMCLKCSMPNRYLNLPIEDLQGEELEECSAETSEDDLKGNQNFKDSRTAILRLEDIIKFGGRIIKRKTRPASLETLIMTTVAGIMSALTITLACTYVAYQMICTGEYETNEDNLDEVVAFPEEGVDALVNPVVVLDKNSDSYVNLGGPI